MGNPQAENLRTGW